MDNFELIGVEKKKHIAKCMIKMLNDLGFRLEKGMKILDFGCGKGDLVQAFTDLGYDAYGVDIKENTTIDADHFKKLDLGSYVFPFENDTFDFIYSTSVLEHTQNIEECIAEIYRVLKPGGVTYHTLPSLYRIRESHTLVPLGGVLQSEIWFKIWAFLGIRTENQKGMRWEEVVEINKSYCRTGLNYHTFRQLKRIITGTFGNLKVVGKEYIDNMPGGAARLGRKIRIKGFDKFIFIFREWHILMKKEMPDLSKN